MNIYVKILLFGLLTFVVQHLGKLFYITRGYDNTILKHYPGKCHVVKGFTTKGAEDMTLLPSGKVIITSGLVGLSKEFSYTNNVAKGAIYVMDTSKSYESVDKLEIKGWPADRNFEPHGIHHWVHENKSISVFIVLHKPETVARFLYDGDMTLTLTKAYENSEYMRNINSVSLTSEDSFYLTNMLQARFGDRFSAMIEFILYNVITSNVLHVSGDSYSVAADGLRFPNGLTADGRYLYVATKGAIRIFSRNADNSLQLYKSIHINIGNIDNIKFDDSGDLWVGCQNVLGDVLDYLEYPDNRNCHSTVIRIRDPTGVADIESVFVDDTSLIQASTVAIYTNRKLLIGSIVDKMAVCDVNYLHGE